MFRRSAVLCAFATTFSISIAIAQPPDVPVAVAEPKRPAEALPLLPMTLEEFLARNGGLTRLKLKMDKATAEEIAAEMKKQTGLDIVLDDQLSVIEDEEPLFSIEATGQPFWEAVAGWNRGDTKIYLQRDWKRLNLVPWSNPTQSGRALTAGPFYLVINSILRSTTRLMNSDPKLDATTKPILSESLALQNSLQTDPKFSSLIASISTEVESARDDRGRAVERGENKGYTVQTPNDTSSLSLILKPAQADAKSLQSLKGLIRMAVIDKSERWEIDLKATPKIEKTFKSETGEITYRLDGVSENDTRSTVDFHITRKAIGPQRFFMGANWRIQLGDTNSRTRSIRFFNAAGEMLSSGNYSGRGAENRDIQTSDIKISIDREQNVKDPTPAKIIIDVPLEWREVQVPFEFKDLPLP